MVILLMDYFCIYFTLKYASWTKLCYFFTNLIQITQVQQQIAGEYDQLKDLMNTISMFKSDNPNIFNDRPLGMHL